MNRIEQVGPSFGSQFLLAVLQDGDKTTVLYLSNHIEDKTALFKTVLQPFEAPKTEKISGADANDVSFAKSNDKNFVLINGNIHKLIDIVFWINCKTTFYQDAVVLCLA